MPVDHFGFRHRVRRAIQAGGRPNSSILSVYADRTNDTKDNKQETRIDSKQHEAKTRKSARHVFVRNTEIITNETKQHSVMQRKNIQIPGKKYMPIVFDGQGNDFLFRSTEITRNPKSEKEVWSKNQTKWRKHAETTRQVQQPVPTAQIPSEVRQSSRGFGKREEETRGMTQTTGIQSVQLQKWVNGR